MNGNYASEVTGRRFIPHAAAARIRGVSTRTLDRWIKAGIVAQPSIINKRKYHILENIEAIGRDQTKGAA